MRGAAPVHPLWRRWVAAVCLLLAGVVGTAQAVHTHGKLVPRTKVELHLPAADGQTLGGEEHCPLCVALHTSAMPEAQAPTYALLSGFVAPVPEQVVARAETLWHFARFSRPPPVRG